MSRSVPAALLVLAALTVAPATAGAVLYSYTPYPSDIGDLDHYKYYTWGIGWTHQDETITDAVLTLNGVYDWVYEGGDFLYIHLLDRPALGVRMFTDNQGGGDNFAGQGYWIASWSDPYGDWQHRRTLSYSLKNLGLLDEFATFANNDGRFGFGFDPDCHYFNSGVRLDVTTAAVPEPGTLSLLGVGLLGTAAFARRRRS